MASPQPNNLIPVNARHRLRVHVGSTRQAIEAGLRFGTGPYVWRGSAGSAAVETAGADPVTSGAAWVDAEMYTRQPLGLETVGDRLSAARVSVVFVPGFFADHREPRTLGHYFSRTIPATDRLMRRSGVRASLVPVVAITGHWLTNPALRARLINEFDSHDGDIGVVMASAFNPLGAAAAVAGAVELVGAAGNVVVLRSDEAAVGLIAAGARAATVGTSSTARHLYIGRGSKNRRPGPGHEVFHLASMSWIKHYRLDVFAVPRQDLSCPCHICRGRSILRFAAPELACEAMAHSVACLQLLHGRIMATTDPMQSWLAECQRAAAAAARLEAAVPEFTLGRAARAWSQALHPAP
jgi:hypothetical protein